MAKPTAIKPMASLKAGMNMLVYGDNGTGKTPLIGTSPNCLILNGDPPEAVLSAKMNGSTAEVWTLRDWNDAEEAHDYLRNEKHGYEWVWLDGIGGLQESGLAHIMEDLVARKKHRNLYVPDQHEYLENMNRLRLWIKWMAGLPFNFGVTAHPFRLEYEEDKEIVYPWVQGKGMPQSVCGFMNVIAFVRIGKNKAGEVQQMVYTKRLPRYYARDRFAALPSPMINPTIPQIEELVKKKVGDSQTPTTVVRATKSTAKRKVIG